MEKELKISVVGAGSWGTAVANYLAESFGSVTLWAREAEVVSAILTRRENTVFLPDIALSEVIIPENDLKKAFEKGEIIFLAVPSQFLRSVLLTLKECQWNNKIFINLAKGIEVSSLKTCSQVAKEIFGSSVLDRWITLSGPSFARELANKHPTAVVLASENIQLASEIQHLFSTSLLRMYTSQDLIGVELAGSIKNVIAIASGIVSGMGFGYNTRAALITRAMIEITRLGLSFGAKKETFWGLAGIGDLMLTCFGELSRNFQFGRKLVQQNNYEVIKGFEKMVVEGVETTRAVIELAQKIKIELPICEQVYKIIFEQAPVQEAIKALMMRSLKKEWIIN